MTRIIWLVLGQTILGKERNYNDFCYSLKLSDKFVLCLKLIKVDDEIKAKTCLFEREDSGYKKAGNVVKNKLYRTRKGMFYIKRRLPKILSAKSAELLYLDDFILTKALTKTE